MELAKIKSNFQLTIPSRIRRKIRLKVGDYLEMEVAGDALVLKPVRIIKTGEAPLPSPAWLERESMADKDLAAGRTLGPFTEPRQAFEALRRGLL